MTHLDCLLLSSLLVINEREKGLAKRREKKRRGLDHAKREWERQRGIKRERKREREGEKRERMRQRGTERGGVLTDDDDDEDRALGMTTTKGSPLSPGLFLIASLWLTRTEGD